MAILLILLVLPAFPLQVSNAQETFPLLLGYGGWSYLPFVGGSELVFMAGETLTAFSPSTEVVLKLIPPSGDQVTVTLKPRTRVAVRTFGPQDVGTWFLEDPSGQRMTIRVVDPAAPLFGTLSIERWSEDLVLLRVQGSSAVGFETTERSDADGVPRVLPGQELTVNVPVPLRGAVVYLMYPDRVSLTGTVGGIPFSYSTDAVIARYDFDLPFGMTNFTVRLPLLGTVGPGGTFPMRYGTVLVQVVGISPTGQRVTFTQRIEVSPFGSSVPRLTSTKTVPVVDLLERDLELIYLNYRSGSVERLRFRVPHYGLMVIDARRMSFIEDYSASLRGHVAFRVGIVTYFLPSTIGVPPQGSSGPLELEKLRVYGFDVSQLVGEVILRPNEVTIVSVPVSNVDLRVRVAGSDRLLEAQLLVNGSGPIRVPGRTTLRLPSGYYNLTAVTPFGTVSKVVSALSDVSVELVVYSLTEEATALLAAALLQASVLGYLLLRGLLSRRRGQSGSR
ncbi:MAG: hypothetical protein QXO17_01980 [Nitrososphaerota archaeon]|nr:hypothetical protein [Candidatus Calditenuis fumarioli]